MTESTDLELNKNLHDEGKKDFYGLLRKKQQEDVVGVTEKTPAVEPAPVKAVQNVPVDRQAQATDVPAIDDKDEIERLLSNMGNSQETIAQPADPGPSQEPKGIYERIADIPDRSAEIDEAIFKVSEAMGKPSATRADTERTILPPPASAGQGRSEEEIINEFNSLINKGAGITTKPKDEPVAEKVKVKEKKTLKKKFEVEPYDPERHGPMAIFPGVQGYEEIERYWVDEPYAFTVVLYSEQTNNYLYYVVEPSLTVFEKELLEEVYERLQDVLVLEDLNPRTDRKELLTVKTTQVISDYIGKIDTKSYHKILYYIIRDYLEFGKINPIMHDNFIEDISNNGFDAPIFLYHKNYENIMTNITFSEKQLDSYVIRLAQRCGKHISIAEPMVDATMPDGSRIQMTLGKEITTRGSTFTIRKFKEVPITPVDLIVWNTFSSETMSYLWLCIENNKSLIYSGGTASGKTSSLNAVALFIPPKAKVISLEDTRELKLPHLNWIPGLTRDSFTADGKGAIEMFALLKAALRQRPEYLLVGEVRGKEALTLFQAMSTGHTTFSTMHADSVESAIHRLENPPISVPRTMITALDIISIQSQTYLKNKRVRRNMKLVEIHDIDPNTRNIRTNDVYVWNSGTDRFDRVGESKIINEIAQRRAWSKKDISNELVRRQRVLEYMVKNNIRDFKQVSAIIQAYAVKPDRVLEKLGIKD